MKTKHVFQILLILVISFSLASCEDDDAEGNVKTATLTHGGFDFSTGLGGSFEGEGTAIEGADFDGEVIGWRPGGGGYGTGIYWRNDQEGLQNEQMAMGPIDLIDVSSIPSVLDSIQNLIVGNVYIVKCKDGYAAFKVKALGADDKWEADVDYVFTSGTSF